MKDKASYPLYYYYPSLPAAILFVVFFAIVSVAHLAQTIHYRMWWTIILPLGTVLELVGYAMRIYGHYDPFTRDEYVVMMVLLIVTPCFFAAAHFATLGKVMTLFPRKYATFKPVIVTPFFVTVDVVSLIIQGIGGGTGGSADSQSAAHAGSMIAVAGVAVQLFGYVVFNIVFLLFLGSIWRDRHEMLDRFLPLLIAVFCSSMFIVLRSIYRVIEMGAGWTGVINRTEWALYVFDGAFVLLAVIILNCFHPGRYIPNNLSWKHNPDLVANALEGNGAGAGESPETKDLLVAEHRKDSDTPDYGAFFSPTGGASGQGSSQDDAAQGSLAGEKKEFHAAEANPAGAAPATEPPALPAPRELMDLQGVLATSVPPPQNAQPTNLPPPVTQDSLLQSMATRAAQ